MRPLAPVLALICAASTVSAAVEVSFRDGNPWDVFTITSTGCPVTAADLTIDLTTSVAGVLIDTEYGGRGTQDPMPAELSEGLATIMPVTDGDQTLVVKIDLLDEENLIALRMDVDDTTGGQYAPMIHVTTQEVAGATVTLRHDGVETVGTFGADGTARVPLPEALAGCQLIG